MTKGNTLPSSGNSLFLRAAWENGYVGKFTSDCFCFCINCNYTVLVSAEHAGYITLGAKVSGSVVDLTSLNGEVYDSVLYYHYQWYSYQVTHEDKDLRIRLDSYSGNPDIFVNALTIPTRFGMSHFNSRDHFQNEELVLVPEQRAKFNATKGLYYICIYGGTAATYKLTVSNENHLVYLRSGLSESGYADHNEVKLYYYRDVSLASNDTEIAFSMHIMYGGARLQAKLCPVVEGDTYEQFKDTCTITQEELLHPEPDEKMF